MTETGIVNVQVLPELKRDAEKVLAKLGLTPDEAIEEFYRDILDRYQAKGDAWLEAPRVSFCMCWGKTPNAETIAAFKESEEGGGARFSSVAELRADIENDFEDDEVDD